MSYTENYAFIGKIQITDMLVTGWALQLSCIKSVYSRRLLRLTECKVKTKAICGNNNNSKQTR